MIQYAIVHSDFGRSLAAIRQDETLAASRGVDVFAHKLAIFTVSAALAGLGGGLQVEFLRAAAPQSFGFLENVNLVLIVIVGGAGSLFGPVLGALLFVALPELLRATDALRMLLFGAALLVLALFAPRGLWGLAAAAARKFRSRELAVADAGHLEVDGITKSFGGVRAVDGASFRLAGPGIYGLIGPNGAGKTTLFDVVCGRQFANLGTVASCRHAHRPAARASAGTARSARTFQECRVFEQETCLDNVLFAAQDKHLGREWLQALGRHRNARRAVLAEAEYLLELVGLRRLQNEPAGNLSYGQRRLLEIVSSLIARPRLLLLDEPASGINPTLLNMLRDFLLRVFAERQIVLLVVEHNMEFVMSLASHILVMHQGRLLEEGPPAAIQTSRRVIEAYLG